MVLNGDKGYDLHFNPTDKLSDSQKMYAKKQHDLFVKWYSSWKNRQVKNVFYLYYFSSTPFTSEVSAVELLLIV